MFGTIAERYDLTNSVLSFGIHHWWRHLFVNMIPKQFDGVVLDLCTGTGALLPLIAKRAKRVIGSDFCLPMLDRARTGEGKLLTPVCQADALRLPFADRSVDIVTVAFGVRNLEDLRAGLTEMARTLKPDGQLLILEFGQPSGPIAPLYRFYSRYLMPVIGGVLTGNRDAYTYLPETASRFPCREAFLEVARQCGFPRGECRPLTGGIAYMYRLCRSAA